MHMAAPFSGAWACRRDPGILWFCLRLLLCTSVGLSFAGLSFMTAAPVSGQGSEEMQIEISKIGLGKEVVITQGVMEWFMRVEVTPENTVVVRQEKQGERYLVDESETHDRSMTAAEVDGAITDFINHVNVKRQAK
jgi:hypothetical protein